MVSKQIGIEETERSLSFNIETSDVKKPKDSLILYFSAIGACLMTFSIAANGVWTSPVIGKLRSNNTDINPLKEPVTTYQIAILTSVLPLGLAIGPLFLTKLCDGIGRRKTLMLLSAVTILTNTFISISAHIYIYCIARFLYGVCAGGAVPVISIFLSEISENHNRGMIGCFMGMSYPFGNLYVYILGPLFSIKIFTLLCTLPNILNILCFLIFIPESPYYLAEKGERMEAVKALERLRNKKPSEVEEEFEMIIQTLKVTSKEKQVTWKQMLTVGSLRKGFILAMALNMMPQLSGVGAILAYAAPLFDASGITLKGDTVGIIIGLVCTFSALLPPIIIERVGRRPLLIVSTLGGSIPLFALGMFFHLKNTYSPLINNFLFLPIVSILIYVFLFSIGLGVIPGAIMGELFPSNVKAKASSACCFTNFILFFVISSLFPIMSDLMGPSWCLWMFSLMEALSFVFVYFLVPEIKGKSLLEVQELLSK